MKPIVVSGLKSMLQDGVEMGLDPAALGPADALLLGSTWELPVHWCAMRPSVQLVLPVPPRHHR
jgi:hypothetical protein